MSVVLRTKLKEHIIQIHTHLDQISDLLDKVPPMRVQVGSDYYRLVPETASGQLRDDFEENGCDRVS